MNANWPPQMPAIKDWLIDSTSKLAQAMIPSARLDCELILSYCLSQNRTYVHAHYDDIIYPEALEKADKLVKMRQKRIPLAYLLGFKEFYGRKFQVTGDTLIPRPESETIIDILKQIDINPNSMLIDVGTGSGCLGITAKLEKPSLNVTLSDISHEALKIADANAKNLGADVQILQNDLLKNVSGKFDIIIANLPYVDIKWERSPETNYEPSLALFADNSGKQLIEQLINQSFNLLNDNGYLIIEADPEQHESLINFANKKSFTLFAQQDYVFSLRYSN